MTERRARGDGGPHWDDGRKRWVATRTIGRHTRGKRLTRRAYGRSIGYQQHFRHLFEGDFAAYDPWDAVTRAEWRSGPNLTNRELPRASVGQIYREVRDFEESTSRHQQAEDSPTKEAGLLTHPGTLGRRTCAFDCPEPLEAEADFSRMLLT